MRSSKRRYFPTYGCNLQPEKSKYKHPERGSKWPRSPTVHPNELRDQIRFHPVGPGHAHNEWVRGLSLDH
jgi:hypothetical protein